MKNEIKGAEIIAFVILGAMLLTSFVGAVKDGSMSSAVAFTAIVISESIDGFRKNR